MCAPTRCGRRGGDVGSAGCSGATTSSSGTLTLDAPDAETVNTVMDGRLTLKDGGVRPMHVTGYSHWLAADCGDVKPAE